MKKLDWIIAMTSTFTLAGNLAGLIDKGLSALDLRQGTAERLENVQTQGEKGITGYPLLSVPAIGRPDCERIFDMIKKPKGRSQRWDRSQSNRWNCQQA